METLELKKAIYNYCKGTHGGVTYAELERVFEDIGYDYEGEYSSTDSNDTNLIFWSGWNKNTFDIINEMVKDNYLKRSPCDMVIYLMDGKVSTLPIAHRYPSGGYKKPHWLPIVFDIGEKELN